MGHLWRFGAEVDASRIGSPLVSSLTIYDAQGQAIPTREGVPTDFPRDPYLFAGLEPGTYYLGVSAGSGGATPSGGAFDLRVVADPADAPTTVESISVDDADPTENVPTGLTIGFSGAMDELAMAANPSGLIEVVDASGRAWSAGATSYDAADASATFVFDQALPAGSYTVVLAGQGGLVDLIGRAPVAPGLPAGDLGRFVVPSTAPGHDPEDLGPIFLDAAEHGVSSKIQLGPNGDATYRFVVTVRGFYDVVTADSGGAATITAGVGGATIPLGLATPGVTQDHVVYLQPGVVTLDVKAGPHGSTIDWSLLLNGGSYDLLLDNGVGQTSPLGLRLVTPTPLDAPVAGIPDGPAAPTSVVTPTASAPSTVANAALPGPASVPANPGGTYIASAVGMVGYPSIQDNAVAVVGPVAPGGMTALSSSAAGIPQGLSVGTTSRSAARRGEAAARPREWPRRPSRPPPPPNRPPRNPSPTSRPCPRPRPPRKWPRPRGSSTASRPSSPDGSRRAGISRRGAGSPRPPSTTPRSRNSGVIPGPTCPSPARTSRRPTCPAPWVSPSPSSPRRITTSDSATGSAGSGAGSSPDVGGRPPTARADRSPDGGSATLLEITHQGGRGWLANPCHPGAWAVSSRDGTRPAEMACVPRPDGRQSP